MARSHFVSRYDAIGKQAISAAVIIDSKGEKCGKIIVRYTESRVGIDREIGVSFDELDINSTNKSQNYHGADPLIYLVNSIGYRVFVEVGCSEVRVGDGMSDFTSVRILKKRNKIYRVYWAL